MQRGACIASASARLTTTRPVCPNPSTLDNVNEPDRAAVIRAKLVSGELPRAKPEKVWAGKGTDQPCAGCGGMIASADVEFEVDLPGAPPGHAALPPELPHDLGPRAQSAGTGAEEGRPRRGHGGVVDHLRSPAARGFPSR